MSSPQCVKERQSSCPIDKHVTSSEKITQMLPRSPVALYSCGPKPCEDVSVGNGCTVRRLPICYNHRKATWAASTCSLRLWELTSNSFYVTLVEMPLQEH